MNASPLMAFRERMREALRARRDSEPVRQLRTLRRIVLAHEGAERAAMDGELSAEEYLKVTDNE